MAHRAGAHTGEVGPGAAWEHGERHGHRCG